MEDRRKEQKERQMPGSGWTGPGVEIWPDEYALWVMGHRRRRRVLECNIPYLQSSPFCGQGYQG